MKKVISITIVLVMMLSLSVTSFAATITPKTPSTDENGVYQIGTAEELYGFAQLVNNGGTSACAVLTADIVVNKDVLNESGELNSENSGDFATWTPIGNSTNQYSGTFDGRKYTISGLYYNDSSTSFVGLFGYLGGGGKISNVKVAGSYISGSSSVGSLCGCNYGTISGCSNSGTVCGADQKVGGICGKNADGGLIENCYNTGKVHPISGKTLTFYYGGVCGYNDENGVIKSCYNTGEITNIKSAGGVCGECYVGSVIIDCYNEGTVSSSGSYAGGICANNSGTISNCYNKGTVTSTSAGVGGICGWCDNRSQVIGCYNAGGVSGGSNRVGGINGMNKGTITACYNIASVTGSGENVGGVCGENFLNITGCHNIGEVSGGTNVGTVCGYNGSNSMIKGCYAKKFNDSDKVCARFYANTVKDCAMYTDTEFGNGTVLDLLNATLENAGEEVFFYQVLGAELYPNLIDSTVTAYTVTIPKTVKLGDSVTISAADVTLKRVEVLTVALTQTSEDDNSFRLRTTDGTELTYTVMNGDSSVAAGDTVLSVNYTESSKAVVLSFSEPTDLIYSGEYKGTLTFTISVE